MSSYRALASEVGCLSAEIYKEIRRCLRLRGGVVVNGVKWIWKTSEELAERLGVNEKTIRRHLKALVQMGWLKREQHQKRWGMRAYHYTLGENAPLKLSIQGYSSSTHIADQRGSKRSGAASNSPIAPLVEHLHGMQGVRSLRTQQMSSSVTAPSDPIATGSVPQEQRLAAASAEVLLQNRLSGQTRSSVSRDTTRGDHASSMPLQSGRSVSSEPDILSASINRNTTSKNSPTGHNSQNSQGASRQTKKIPTNGDQSRKGVANDSLQTFGTYSDDPSLGKGEVESSKLRAHNPKVDWLEHRIHNPEVRGEGGIRTPRVNGTRRTKRSDLYAVSSIEPESGATKAAPLRADWPDTTGMSEGLLRVCIENARNLAFPSYIRGSQSFRIAS